MDKNQKRTNAESHCSMTNYEIWTEELIEQAKQDSRILRRMLFLSLVVNVILVAVLSVVVKG